MKKILFVLILLFFSNFVFSLDCQYFIEEEVQTDYNKVINKNTDEYVDVPVIEPSNKQANGGKYNRAYFLLVNDYPFQLKFRLIVDYEIQNSLSCVGGSNVFNEEITIDKFDTKEIVYWSANRSCKVTTNWDSLRVILLESDDITAPLIQTIKTKNKICLGNDDGMTCSKNEDCGGGFCVEGICNNKNEFYNGINPCSENEVACNNNNCIQKGSVELGFKPVCSEQECVFGYLDSNGICAKTQLVLEQEKLDLEKKNFEELTKNIILFFWIFIILIIVIIISFIVFTHGKKVNAETEIKLMEAKVKEKEYQIKQLQNDLTQIKNLTEEKRKEIRHQLEINNKEKDLLKERWKIATMAYPSKHASGRLVFKNPFRGGYECFYEKGRNMEELTNTVHVWVWIKANGRYPRKGYHIHHIDGNKYNHNINNLEEVYGPDHLLNHKNQYWKN